MVVFATALVVSSLAVHWPVYRYLGVLADTLLRPSEKTKVGEWIELDYGVGGDEELEYPQNRPLEDRPQAPARPLQRPSEEENPSSPQPRDEPRPEPGGSEPESPSQEPPASTGEAQERDVEEREAASEAEAEESQNERAPNAPDSAASQSLSQSPNATGKAAGAAPGAAKTSPGSGAPEGGRHSKNSGASRTGASANANPKGAAAAGEPSAKHAKAKQESSFGLNHEPIESDLRLTGKELAERGVRDVGEAIAMLPDVNLRMSGRGEMIVDIRGARNRSVLVRIDGVPVDEPYFGSFDISSIPVTDIQEIRVSKVPASPGDGIGGSGGVIDITTRPASGKRQLWGQLQGAHPWDGQGSFSGRMRLSDNHALRLSAGGRYARRELEATSAEGAPVVLIDQADRVHGGFRSEHRFKRGLLSTDGWAQRRSYLVPPEPNTRLQVLQIEPQTSIRGALAYRFLFGAWTVQGYGYAQYQLQRWARYTDPSLDNALGIESFRSQRQGTGTSVYRPLGERVRLGMHGFFQTDGVEARGVTGDQTQGRVNLLQGASSLRWDIHRRVRLTSAVGVASATRAATPWPEAKLSLSYRPIDLLNIRLTGGRKGRLPTLRERFEPIYGNPALKPEISNFAELKTTLSPIPQLKFSAAGYIRFTEGFVRFNDERTTRINQGSLRVQGLDLRADAKPLEFLRLGTAYAFIHAADRDIANGALENMPQHRVDGWVEAHYRQRLGTWVRARWVDARVEGGGRVPPFVGCDVAVWAKPHEKIRTSFRVENLLDYAQYLRPGVRTPGRTFVLSIDGTWD